jgi:hypothetical protein
MVMYKSKGSRIKKQQKQSDALTGSLYEWPTKTVTKVALKILQESDENNELK